MVSITEYTNQIKALNNPTFQIIRGIASNAFNENVIGKQSE